MAAVSIEKRRIYSGKDLAILVPTKDRLEKIHNLLESIAKQTIPCGRIIVVDSGESVKDVVMHFSDRLPVEYYECYPPGQIRQGKMPALRDGGPVLRWMRELRENAQTWSDSGAALLDLRQGTGDEEEQPLLLQALRLLSQTREMAEIEQESAAGT